MNTFPQLVAAPCSDSVTHLLILVSCDCYKLCLLEDVGAEGALSLLKRHRGVIGLHHVDSWLILMHRIQDQL